MITQPYDTLSVYELKSKITDYEKQIADMDALATKYDKIPKQRKDFAERAVVAQQMRKGIQQRYDEIEKIKKIIAVRV